MTHKKFIWEYLDKSIYLRNKWKEENGVLYIKTWLDLRHTDITSLPDNLHIYGWLSLRTTEISSLPENLYIRDDLILSDSNITTIPDSLIVGEYIFSYDALLMSEQKQIDLITSDKRNINIIKKPTEKAKTLHNLLWEL